DNYDENVVEVEPGLLQQQQQQQLDWNRYKASSAMVQQALIGLSSSTGVEDTRNSLGATSSATTMLREDRTPLLSSSISTTGDHENSAEAEKNTQDVYSQKENIPPSFMTKQTASSLAKCKPPIPKQDVASAPAGTPSPVADEQQLTGRSHASSSAKLDSVVAVEEVRAATEVRPTTTVLAQAFPTGLEMSCRDTQRQMRDQLADYVKRVPELERELGFRTEESARLKRHLARMLRERQNYEAQLAEKEALCAELSRTTCRDPQELEQTGVDAGDAVGVENRDGGSLPPAAAPQQALNDNTPPVERCAARVEKAILFGRSPNKKSAGDDVANSTLTTAQNQNTQVDTTSLGPS
ncbi:unnamed protein product, partial [Amoebophrya sp. A25]